MPLWKVYHPVGAFTAEEKKALAKRVTEVYAGIPLPKFYVVFIFEEVAKDSCFVGGELHNKFVRFDRPNCSDGTRSDPQRMVG